MPAVNRPAPRFRDPELAGAQRRAQAQREAELEAERERATPEARLRGAFLHFCTSPLLWLLLFLVGLSFAVNRGRIGVAVSGGALLAAPSGDETLLQSYLQDWHAIGGGTSAAGSALTGLFGLLGVPFGGADHAVAVLLMAAMPLAGISAYCATRATRLSRGQRAALAALWALLPAGASASSYGRLDTMFAHVLLPIVLAGVVSVLRGAPAGVDSAGRETGRSRWLSTTAATALAVAVLSSAAPVMYLLILLIVLVGFVLLRPAPVTGVRRAAALFFVVLLPVGLLLPWPAVLLTRPSVFLHGVGSSAPAPGFSLVQLVTLGPGLPALAGVLVLLIALLMLISVPSLRMLPGLAVVLLGAATAVAVAGQRRPRLPDGALLAGDAGPALLLMAAGLFLVILVGAQEHARRAARDTPGSAASHARLKAGVALALIAVMAAGAVLGGARGGVRARPAPALPKFLQLELTANRALVLTTATGDQPARISTAALPRLGDDDLVPTPEAASRLAAWSAAITSGGEEAAATAIAEAAASGVGALVLPAGARAGSGAPAQLLADARQHLRRARGIPGAAACAGRASAGARARHPRAHGRSAAWSQRQHHRRGTGHQCGAGRAAGARRARLQRPGGPAAGAGRGERDRLAGPRRRHGGGRRAGLRSSGGCGAARLRERGHRATLGYGPAHPAAGPGRAVAVHAAALRPAAAQLPTAQSCGGSSGPSSCSPSGSTVAASTPR